MAEQESTRVGGSDATPQHTVTLTAEQAQVIYDYVMPSDLDGHDNWRDYLQAVVAELAETYEEAAWSYEEDIKLLDQLEQQLGQEQVTVTVTLLTERWRRLARYLIHASEERDEAEMRRIAERDVREFTAAFALLDQLPA